MVKRAHTRRMDWGKKPNRNCYSQGYAELLEKLLQNQMPIRARIAYLLIASGWTGSVYWIFLQDNQAGLLATFGGIKWFAVKTLALAGLALASAIIIGLILRFTKVRQ